MRTVNKKLILTLCALSGFGASVVASAILVHDAMFKRYERPDYSTVFGNYDYERLKDTLPREEFYIPTRKARLYAYYYPTQSCPKGLVVLSHGMHAGADDYLPIIEYMTQGGYNVLAYDACGTYSSDGESTVGMCQSLVDLDGVLEYVRGHAKFNRQPLFLIGHSWGGYAAGSVLSIKDGICACACIAPMNNGYTMILEKGEEYAGKLARIPAPIINAYQKMLFGSYTTYSASCGISSVNIPVLVAHGVDDEVIGYSTHSVISLKESITNPNVIYYTGLGLQGGHDSIWHSKESAAYLCEIKDRLRLYEIEKGGKLSCEELQVFSESINHRLASEINSELLSLILTMFDGAPRL